MKIWNQPKKTSNFKNLSVIRNNYLMHYAVKIMLAMETQGVKYGILNRIKQGFGAFYYKLLVKE